MMYSEPVSIMWFKIFESTVAPKLSPLETNKISLPSSKRESNTPEETRLSNKSPWPGGYHASNWSSKCFGTGKRLSLKILGYLDWLKVLILILWDWYFFTINSVSLSVLKEFINKSGTSVSNVLLRNSICLTDKSRKDWPSLTSMTDLGPTQPIEVPKPPFNFKTANLSKFLFELSSFNEAYDSTFPLVGEEILSQSNVFDDVALSARYLLNKAKNESISFSNLNFSWLFRSAGRESTSEFRAFLICEAATFEEVFSNAKVDCDFKCLDIVLGRFQCVFDGEQGGRTANVNRSGNGTQTQAGSGIGLRGELEDVDRSELLRNSTRTTSTKTPRPQDTSARLLMACLCGCCHRCCCCALVLAPLGQGDVGPGRG